MGVQCRDHVNYESESRVMCRRQPFLQTFAPSFLPVQSEHRPRVGLGAEETQRTPPVPRCSHTARGRGAGDSVRRVLWGMSEQTGRLDVAWTLRGQKILSYGTPMWGQGQRGGSHREGRARGASTRCPPAPCEPPTHVPLASCGTLSWLPGLASFLTCFSTRPPLLEATSTPDDGGSFTLWDT